LARVVAKQPGAEARHLSAALAAGDSAAMSVLQETAADLAFGLSHVTHLMHPQVVILGGGLSSIGEPLRAAVANALPEHLMEVMRPGPEIRLAALGEKVVPVGCMVACKQKFAA
jgi:glucokinase